MSKLMQGCVALAGAWMAITSGQCLAGTVHRMKVCSDKGCSWASAVCVNEDPQIYLTVAHAFRLGHGEVWIDMHSGKPARARHILTAASEDLAIVVVDKGGDGKAYRVSIDYPQRGQQYTLIGFPGGKPKKLTATCTDAKFGNLAIRAFSRPVSGGFSGGAVSKDGTLFGIIGWTDEKHALATTGPTLLALLRKAFPAEYPISRVPPRKPVKPAPKPPDENCLQVLEAVKRLEKKLDEIETKTGPQGPPGPPGPPGKTTSVDLTHIEERITRVESNLQNFRARLRVRVVPKEN